MKATKPTPKIHTRRSVKNPGDGAALDPFAAPASALASDRRFASIGARLAICRTSPLLSAVRERTAESGRPITGRVLPLFSGADRGTADSSAPASPAGGEGIAARLRSNSRAIRSSCESRDAASDVGFDSGDRDATERPRSFPPLAGAAPESGAGSVGTRGFAVFGVVDGSVGSVGAASPSSTGGVTGVSFSGVVGSGSGVASGGVSGSPGTGSSEGVLASWTVAELPREAMVCPSNEARVVPSMDRFVSAADAFPTRRNVMSAILPASIVD